MLNLTEISRECLPTETRSDIFVAELAIAGQDKQLHAGKEYTFTLSYSKVVAAFYILLPIPLIFLTTELAINARSSSKTGNTVTVLRESPSRADF